MMNISASNYTCIAYNYPSVKRFRTVVTGSFADATMKFGYYALDMLSSLNNAKSDAMEALYIATCLVVLFADIIILPFVMSSTGEGRHIINQLLHIPKRVVVKIKDNVTDIINSASGQTKNEEQESKPIEYSVLEMMKLNKRTVHSTSAYFGKLFHIKYYLIPLGVLLLMFEGIALARYMLYLSNTARLNSVLAYYRNIIMLPTICLQALLYQEYQTYL
ncbi:MAG: hypothetical protein P4M11_07770 [Candidatus Pacebacteria bacterium]|nr:hypothetical protein [Candidatus Paceibacterota bacterium]